jgi:ribonuclease P protein component
VTKEPSATPRNRESAEVAAADQGFKFSKEFRILRRTDFRRVYDKGIRVSGPYFVAFCLAREENQGSRVGFTVPRALGKSVKRNRIKRRMRESVRLELNRTGPGWDIVLNARRTVLTAPFEDLRREIQRIFQRCGKL